MYLNFESLFLMGRYLQFINLDLNELIGVLKNLILLDNI
ncbi:hypothetical protein FLCH110379_18090 [Flavobacterium chungbukense]